MGKRRVSTTISTKDWKLLKEYTEKFGTQQKVLEVALENLDKDSTQPTLSQEDQAWIKLAFVRKSLSIVQKNLFLEFIKTANPERMIGVIIELKIPRFAVEWQYQKPLKKCSLKEIMDGIVINFQVANWYDSINYAENSDHYALKIFHSAGINNSIITKAFFEDLFREYGAKIETEMSDNSLFVKVFKTLS